MTKFTAFVILVALRIVFHPSEEQKVIAPFTSQQPQTESAYSVATSKNTGNTEKFRRQFVALNESADIISAMETNRIKNFTETMIAFSSVKSETGLYRYNENEPDATKNIYNALNQ
jgi:hypothetical protein